MKPADAPKISVIVPNYNHAAFLPRRLDSIFAQTMADIEVILLDDASSDNSRVVLERYRDHPAVTEVVFNQENSGSAFRQWKKGVSLARGRYIWIAESDDYCAPDFLATALKALESGSDLFYARSLVVDENGQLKNSRNTWLDDLSTTRWECDFVASGRDEIMTALAFKNSLPNASAVVFKRTENVKAWLDRIQDMRYCGDWLFWLHYLSSAACISFSAATTNYFRSHAGVTRRTSLNKKRNKEITRVLRYALRTTKGCLSVKMLVQYYFDHHYQLYPKRRIVENLLLFLQQATVSLRFAGCWWRFYFSSKKCR